MESCKVAFGPIQNGEKIDSEQSGARRPFHIAACPDNEEIWIDSV